MRSLHSILTQELERYRRHRLVKKANEAYARLREDPLALREMEVERRLFENALCDGLRDDPYEP